MITFKQFLRGFKRKYVCVTFTPTTNKNLMEYAISNGFNLEVSYDDKPQKPEDFEFHLTIFYTNSYHDTKNQEISLEPFKLSPEGFELLGENNDVPVLKIKPAGKLMEIRETFEKQGYRDNWPSWKPHISLSYERKQYDIDLEMPSFDIVVDKMKIEDSS